MEDKLKLYKRKMDSLISDKNSLNENKNLIAKRIDIINNELNKLAYAKSAHLGGILLNALNHDKDLLEALAPEHNRTSCDDVNLGNQDNHCPRCVLMYAIKCNNWHNEYSFELKILNTDI